MNYIIFTATGAGLPVAYKLQQEGHTVLVGLVQDKQDILSKDETSTPEDPESKRRRLRLYDGMLEIHSADEMVAKMKEIKNPKEWFVFFDMNYFFKFVTQIRHLGFHGNFPTEEDYSYEQNRRKADEFVKKHYKDLQVLPTHTFYSIAEAKAFLEKSNEFWVIKPFSTSIPTYIADSDDVSMARQQLITALKMHEETYEESGFLLEKYVKNLVEVTPGRVYYKGKLLGVTINFENKSIGSGEIGYQTGCSADLVIPVDLESKINKIPFPPIVDQLAKEHQGLFFWDASLLIDADTDEIYCGEFCANRPGYNVFFTQVAPLPEVSYYFNQVVAQKNPFILGRAGASVRIFNLNRTSDDKHVLGDIPITIAKEAEKDVWLMDAYKKKDRLYVSGVDTEMAAVTGAGESIDEAVTNLYNNIEGFSVFGKYYRPKFDYISRDYNTSILNRLDYILTTDLVSLPRKLI